VKERGSVGLALWPRAFGGLRYSPLPPWRIPNSRPPHNSKRLIGPTRLSGPLLGPAFRTHFRGLPAAVSSPPTRKLAFTRGCHCLPDHSHSQVDGVPWKTNKQKLQAARR
jgi:hypothetical protein